MNQDRTYSDEWRNLMKANVIPCVKRAGQSNKRWRLIYATSIFNTTPDTFALNDTQLELATVEDFMKKVLRYKDATPEVVEQDIIDGLQYVSEMGVGKDDRYSGGTFAGYIPVSGYNLFRKRFKELCEFAKFTPLTTLSNIAHLIAAWQTHAR